MEPSWKSGGIALVLLIVPLAVAGGGTWEVGGTASASPRPVSTPDDDAPTPDDAAVPEAASARVRAFRGELERLLPLQRWRRADWGVLVTSLDRGDTIFDFNAHRPFIPASNVKLLTAAAALHHLGPDFRYRTLLLSDAPVVDGVLHGDLVLYGTGDPSLSNRYREGRIDPMRELARALERSGVSEVAGDVIGDGTYFSGVDRPRDWGWKNLNDWFAAPVSALTYEENVATLRIGPGPRAGSPLVVTTTPAEAPLRFDVVGRTVAGRPGHPVWALREQLDDPVRIVGEMNPRHRAIWRRISVADPPLFAAARLRAVLEEEGVRVRGEARPAESRDASTLDGRGVWSPALLEHGTPPRVLARLESPPLSELLTVMNRRSHNLFAEAILRTLGRVVDGEGSFAAGSRVVQRFLIREIGVPAEEARPVDGSGLSPTNRVSPYAFVRILEHAAASEWWEVFSETLPEAGNWRGLRRMYRSPAAGNLRAKTGTIERVSALSGVVRGERGERFLFSIISNDVPSTGAAKRVEDRIGIRLASFWRPPVASTSADQ